MCVVQINGLHLLSAVSLSENNSCSCAEVAVGTVGKWKKVMVLL